MAAIYQCLLTRPSEGGRWISVRWVVKKKAVVGNKITAFGFDERTETEWEILEVYQLEQEDQWKAPDGKTYQCFYHVVR